MVKNDKGFTVVELMLGIAVFAIVTPAIIQSVISLNGLNDRASDLTYANIIAENKIESLRSDGYNALVDGTYDFSADLPASFTPPRIASYTISSPVTGVKDLLVSIQYTDDGVDRILEYKSSIGELGVSQ